MAVVWIVPLLVAVVAVSVIGALDGLLRTALEGIERERAALGELAASAAELAASADSGPGRVRH